MLLRVFTKIKWNLRFVCVAECTCINSEHQSGTCFGEHISLATVCSEIHDKGEFYFCLFDHLASCSPGCLVYKSGHLQDFSEPSGWQESSPLCSSSSRQVHLKHLHTATGFMNILNSMLGQRFITTSKT